MSDIQFWTGREGSKDPKGWYVNIRDEVGNIIGVKGPYPSREMALSIWAKPKIDGRRNYL